jgi:hypothetical protein
MSKFLTKKNHQGGLTTATVVGKSQIKPSPVPTISVKNTQHQSNNNTKSTGGQKPTGKAHAKVMGAAKNLSHGTYL